MKLCVRFPSLHSGKWPLKSFSGDTVRVNVDGPEVIRPAARTIENHKMLGIK